MYLTPCHTRREFFFLQIVKIINYFLGFKCIQM